MSDAYVSEWVSEWVTDWSTLILQCVTRKQYKCFDVDDDYDADRKWVAGVKYTCCIHFNAIRCGIVCEIPFYSIHNR